MVRGTGAPANVASIFARRSSSFRRGQEQLGGSGLTTTTEATPEPCRPCTTAASAPWYTPGPGTTAASARRYVRGFRWLEAASSTTTAAASRHRGDHVVAARDDLHTMDLG